VLIEGRAVESVEIGGGGGGGEVKGADQADALTTT